MNITANTSPELAIKIAYDFARDLRLAGARERDFDDLLERSTEPFARQSLLPYIRGGFTAGFHCHPLPWKRQIEAL